MRTYLITKIFLFLILSNQCLSQSGEHWYYHIDKNNLALQGYDPVAYFSKGEALKGTANFKETYHDVTYHFISKSNQSRFKKNPTSYLPQFGGWCSYAMSADRSTDGFAPSRFPVDPANFKIINDKLYLFAKRPNFDGLVLWNKGDEKELLTRANAFWKSRLEFSDLAETIPEGLNPNARMENLQWQKFMGKWKGSVQWMIDTTTRAYTPEITAKWHFYYGYYGYAIQDDWFPDRYFKGNGIWAGPAIRGYDPLSDEWHMTYIPINSARNNTWMMTAKFNEKGEVEGKLENVDANGNKFIQNIYFYEVSEDKFLWRADRSYNNGKTWIKEFGKSVQTRLE